MPTFETSSVEDLMRDEVDVPDDESSVFGTGRQLLSIVGKAGKPNLVTVFRQNLRGGT